MQLPTKSWQQYEAGVEYKRRIGLFELVRRNERFYRGDQWYGLKNNDLPKPVFNVVRRITDFLISCVSLSGATLDSFFISTFSVLLQSAKSHRALKVVAIKPNTLSLF